MKKLLLSLFALLTVVAASAETTVTFVAGTDVSGNSSAVNDDAVTKDGITIMVSNGVLGRTDNYRCYKGQTMTISSTIGNITNIEFTCTANGTAQYGPGNFTDPSTGDYTFEDAGKLGTWTGNAAEVVLTASTNQVRATQIVVTVGGDATPVQTIDIPVITPETGTYTEAQSVTITAPEGYGVIYTLDGSTPADGNGTYVKTNVATFTVDKTTTVKAISVDNEDPDNCSKVATVTITIVEPAHTVTIAEAHELVGSNVTIQNATIVATASAGVVLADKTGYLYMYKSNHGLKVGDIVNATAIMGSYGGFAQLPNTTVVEVVDSTVVSQPQPAVLDGAALDAWVAAPVQKFIELTGELTISGNYYNIAVEGAQTAIGALVKPEGDLAGKLANGTNVTIQGYAMYVASSKYAYIVATDVKSNTVLPELTPLTLAEFTNGSFESWTEGKAEQWTASTTASNATVEKSEDAHTGVASALVKGGTSNTRLASTEIAVPAGTYTLTFFAKHAGMDEVVSMVRPGYAVATLNESKTAYNSLSGNDYHYLTAAVEVGGQWAEVKNTFVLEEDVILSILVMNQKNSGDVLVDDVEFRLATEEEILGLGVNAITVDSPLSSAIYNVAGQKVNASFKGITIVGGKKVVK